MKITFRPVCKIIILFAVAVLFPAYAQAEEILGRVIFVPDGDSLLIRSSDKNCMVRIHGIDCPELGQAYGKKARKFTKKLTLNKTVSVIPKDIDSYNRIVGDVMLPDGRNLACVLVEAGLAWWYRYYAPNNRRLESLEKKARQKRIGLWADKNPVPPREWRSRKK